jgi:hypothetical protein
MHPLDPDFNDINILPSDPADWPDGWQHPQYISMFEDIISLTQSSTPQQAIGPRTCTNIARKLVICIFLTFLRRRILNMLRLQANPHTAVSHVNRCDYLREFGHGVLGSWHHSVFGFIVNVKFIMGIVITEAREHFEILGLHRPDAPEWERDGWMAVQEHCSKIVGMADAFLNSYMQFTTMQEAQAANRNALSLARITNLTMVFIPLGTIAAIFSMTDEYLPGKGRSWVFLVTAVPVLLLTFAVTAEAREWLRGYWALCRAKRERTRIGRRHMA